MGIYIYVYRYRHTCMYNYRSIGRWRCIWLFSICRGHFNTDCRAPLRGFGVDVRQSGVVRDPFYRASRVILLRG